ncbi:MAG TPA: MerR family transcriptional regulator [Dehalococcoidia bacterium]|nr:MerR family transcriptional regulator [Dehalococcoidia bacterium]
MTTTSAIPAHHFTIGAVAREAGVSVPTVRFYESQGLLSAAPRSEGNYRLYSAADVRRLKLIRRARALGLALPAVRELVRAAFEEPCRAFEPRLKEALGLRIDDVGRQIAELTLLQSQLQNLDAHLAGDCACDHPAGECSGCSLLGEAEGGAGACSCGAAPLAAIPAQ